MTMAGNRRLAANRVVLPDGEELATAIVEISDADVVSVFRLEKEIPSTEWIGGCIELRRGTDGRIHAFKDGLMLSAAASI